MKFVNLTPHEIVVRLPDGSDRAFPSEGNCRVSVTQKEDSKWDGIPIFLNSYGPVEGLPGYQPDTCYIVSLMVINALKADSPDGVIRGDVVSPDSGPTAIREAGKIVAVRGFVRG
jgi:hypothetical protein